MKREYLALLIVAVLCIAGIRLVFQPITPGVSESIYVVYYASMSEDNLVAQYLSGQGTIEQRIEALLANPQDTGLRSVLPTGTQVVNYVLEGETLIVSFSHHLVTNHPGGSFGELITVYGIVNTLTEHPKVSKVQILIEGEVMETIAGHVSLLEPLAEDMSLVDSSSL